MSQSPNIDLLSSILGNFNLSAKVFGIPSFCGQWQLNTNDVAPSQFHLLTRGSCFLHMKHLDAPIPIRAGDLIVAMHGDWHMLSASPVLQGPETLTPEGKGAFTNVICGQFEFPPHARRVLIDLLPPLILVRTNDAGDKFSAIMRLMAEEGLRDDHGRAVVLDKLADALFVMTLRHYAATTDTPRGIMAGLADPKLRDLIAEIHRDPGRDWTIDSMLKYAPLSRSSFIERFSSTLGVTPVSYVANCRMSEAERQLMESSKSIARIATDLGYATEAAFRRAFKRLTGKNPGDIRRQS